LKSPASEVVDIEIHGYLDGELSEQRAKRVEEYLDQERPAAERLVHYGVQGDLIRRLYGPLINRPMPAEMAARLQTINEQRYLSKDDPKQALARGKGRRKGFLIIFFLVLMALFAATVAVIWFFQPALLEPVQTMIRSLSLDKLLSFWS